MNYTDAPGFMPAGLFLAYNGAAHYKAAFSVLPEPGRASFTFSKITGEGTSIAKHLPYSCCQIEELEDSLALVWVPGWLIQKSPSFFNVQLSKEQTLAIYGLTMPEVQKQKLFYYCTQSSDL